MKATKPTRYTRGHIEKKPDLISPGTIQDINGKSYSFQADDFDRTQLSRSPQEGAPVLFVIDPDDTTSVMYVRDLYC
jgi:hypothetical protein